MTIDLLIESGLFWFLLGVGLIVLELLLPGFLAVFFAAGAWITAILLWAGIITGTWLPLTVFLATSLISLLLLRKRFVAVVRGGASDAQNTDLSLEDFIGKSAIVIETIDSSLHTGKIDIFGSTWNARSKSRIEAGSIVEVLSRENLTLIVKPQETTNGR